MKFKFIIIIFLMTFLSVELSHGSNPLDTNWRRYFSEPTIGPQSPVNNIVVDEDGIFISGYFEYENEYLPTLNGIAKWGDSLWLPLGNGSRKGIYGIPFSMNKKNDKIYVGGRFDSAGTIAANNIAFFSLSSNSWNALGNGIDGSVNAIAFCNDTLFVGGVFDTAGTTQAENLAKWNGSNWIGIKPAIKGEIYSMHTFNNEIYIGGNFDTAGNIYSQNIVRFNSDSSSWSSLGKGLNGDANSIYEIDSSIYVGGSFNIASNESSTISAKGVAKWDRNTWNQVGNGIDGEVISLNNYNNNLLAGGSFEIINSDTSYNIAKFDGVNWSGLGSGTDGFINSVSTYNNNVYIGGTFFYSGDSLSRFVALWSYQPPQPIVQDPNVNNIKIEKYKALDINCYPNPFNNKVTIKFYAFHQGKYIIRIIDLLGNEIGTILNDHVAEGMKELVWKPENIDSGIYIVQLITKDSSTMNKLFYIK